MSIRFQKGTEDMVITYTPLNTVKDDRIRWIAVSERSLAEILQPYLAYRQLLTFLLALGVIVPVAVTAYYDGQTLTLRNDARRVWAQTTVPGTLDEMFDDVARRYSLPVPIADVVYSVPYEAFIGRDTKGGFVGRETIDGGACVRLAYTDDFVDVGVGIPSSGQPLPRRVELVYKRDYPIVQYR